MPAPRLGQGRIVDLLNTVWADGDGVHDDLTDATEELRALRDAVRVLAADRTSDPRAIATGHEARVADAIAALNAASARAPGWPTLDGGRLVWASQARGDERTVGELAGEAVRFLAADPELRACLAPRCVLYFVKDHPRRAWCSTGCGNRERAARHYARNRA